MSWVRTYGIYDDSTGTRYAVSTASTSTVVLEDETGPGARVDPRDLGTFPAAKGDGDEAVVLVTRPDVRVADARSELSGQALVPGAATPSRARTRAARSSTGTETDAGSELGASPEARPGAGGLASPSNTRLRMFGVNYQQLDARTLVSKNWPSSLATGAASDEDHLCYIESDAHGRFILTETSDLYYTWIPTAKVYTGSYERMVMPGLILPVNNEPLVALYKDPYVMRAPEAIGGWFMFLARVRFRQGDLDATGYALVQAARDAEANASGNSLADIVAWHCTSQTFREGTLSGPFLVVDSFSAIVPRSGPRLRTWLGAPTAIVLEEAGLACLYVYFNINRAYLLRDGVASAFDAEEPSGAAELVSQMRDLYDTMTFDGGGDRFRSGIGVQKILLSTVQDALTYDGGIKLEDPWERADAWEGSINEPVVFYAPDGRGWEPMRDAVARAVEAADDVDPTVSVPDYTVIHPRASDPAALAGESALFLTTVTPTDVSEEPGVDPELPFVELSVTENTLHGMWMFEFLPTAMTIGEGFTLLGRDLLAVEQLTVSRSDGGEGRIQCFDADPVRLEHDADPTVRVYSRRDPDQEFFKFDET